MSWEEAHFEHAHEACFREINGFGTIAQVVSADCDNRSFARYKGIDFFAGGMYFLWPSLVLSLWSGVDYHVRVFRVLARTELKLKYAGSALGYVWSLARPLLYFAALHMVFASSMRYRIPGEMPALVLITP